ncbi:polysaccharide deacetylase family protein [Paeniroseomonas aquatica]|uniref:polysaccharide deacetylase family protein n=1 Tax=Paeniroseomonas aquatica TaxID=373043 RepID=UPI0036163F05
MPGCRTRPPRQARRTPGNGRKRIGATWSATPGPAAAWRRAAGPEAPAAASPSRSTPTTRPSRCATPTAARCASGQYGNRQGVPRIRALLARYGLRASFFYPAVSALLHPDEIRAVADEGHEIGIHSWIHEANTALPPGVERDLTFRAADVLERLAGRRPVGIPTASWDFSVDTLSIIRELGLLYDSSLMADDDAYELLDHGAPTGIVELPPEWIRDDAPYFNFIRFSALRPYTAPSAVEEIFRAESRAPMRKAACSC